MNHYWGRVYLYCYPMQPCLIGPVDCISRAKIALSSMMRRLWGEHVAWTRATVSSLVFKLPDADVVVARLLLTATDMGDALQPFYGDKVARKYSELLAEHIALAGNLVDARLEGDAGKIAAIEKKWFHNGNEIAMFLSRVNPYLPADEFREIFEEHLMLIKQGIISMLNKDFQTNMNAFDIMALEALEMADIMSGAIIKQFPYRFMSING